MTHHCLKKSVILKPFNRRCPQCDADYIRGTDMNWIYVERCDACLSAYRNMNEQEKSYYRQKEWAKS